MKNTVIQQIKRLPEHKNVVAAKICIRDLPTETAAGPLRTVVSLSLSHQIEPKLVAASECSGEFDGCQQADLAKAKTFPDSVHPTSA